MSVKDKLKLMAAIRQANEKRAQEWATRRKEQADEKK